MTSEAHNPLLNNLTLVERIVTSLARRKRLNEDEREDFASHVRLELLRDDCSVLRQFKGEAKWSTYLTTVITRLFVDYQRRRWGRWRPSAEARRLGATAIRLEELVYRDGIPFEEAAEMLRRNHGVELSIAELAEMLGRLVPRPPRRIEGELGLACVGVDGKVEDRAVESERAVAAQRVESCLNSTIADFGAIDQLFLRFLFEAELHLSEIGRLLCIDQKRLYRHRDRLLASLRRRLTRQGLEWREIEPIFASSQVQISVDYGEPPPKASEVQP